MNLNDANFHPESSEFTYPSQLVFIHSKLVSGRNCNVGLICQIVSKISPVFGLERILEFLTTKYFVIMATWIL